MLDSAEENAAKSFSQKVRSRSWKLLGKYFNKGKYTICTSKTCRHLHTYICMYRHMYIHIHGKLSSFECDHGQSSLYIKCPYHYTILNTTASFREGR
jgi:hypothetical protein